MKEFRAGLSRFLVKEARKASREEAMEKVVMASDKNDSREARKYSTFPRRAAFPETSLPLIRRIKNPKTRAGAQEEWFREYHKAIYACIRGHCHDSEKAKDLLQEFYLKKVVEQKVLEHYVRGEGGFRSYLKGVIRYHCLEAGPGRKPRNPHLLSEAELGNLESAAVARGASTPDEAFDHWWQKGILRRAFAMLEAQETHEAKKMGSLAKLNGKEKVELFKNYYFTPPRERHKLGAQFDVEDVTVRNFIWRLVRQLREIVAGLLEDYVAPEDIQDELATMFPKKKGPGTGAGERE